MLLFLSEQVSFLLSVLSFIVLHILVLRQNQNVGKLALWATHRPAFFAIFFKRKEAYFLPLRRCVIVILN